MRNLLLKLAYVLFLFRRNASGPMHSLCFVMLSFRYILFNDDVDRNSWSFSSLWTPCSALIGSQTPLDHTRNYDGSFTVRVTLQLACHLLPTRLTPSHQLRSTTSDRVPSVPSHTMDTGKGCSAPSTCHPGWVARTICVSSKKRTDVGRGDVPRRGGLQGLRQKLVDRHPILDRT